MNYMGLCLSKNIDIIPKDREVFTVDDYIKYDIWLIMDNDFCGWEWGDLPVIFMSDAAMRDSDWWVPSQSSW